MVRMLHITPEELLTMSFELGRKVYEAGIRPKHAISLWRGGTPVGLGIDVFFRMRGIAINHTTVATESYTGIGTREEVTIKGLEHVIKTICAEDRLLIIDDVFESGKTVSRICEVLKSQARANFPGEITVATLHVKPPHSNMPPDINMIYLQELEQDIWIDYPHELADLVDPDDPDDLKIKHKDPEVWDVIRTHYHEPKELNIKDDYLYVSPRELRLDAMRLGVNIMADGSFFPDYIIALWPGGVITGLPVHEVFKYRMKKTGDTRKKPDHISINTASSYASFMHNVIGIPYLEQCICKDHKLLIIDTTFRSGQTINAVIELLKGRLRRNLNLDNVRVGSVYFNPNDKSTWISQPVWRRPDYYLNIVDKTVVYPHSVHKLPMVRGALEKHNRSLGNIIFGK